jgi:hypothetical protein
MESVCLFLFAFIFWKTKIQDGLVETLATFSTSFPLSPAFSAFLCSKLLFCRTVQISSVFLPCAPLYLPLYISVSVKSSGTETWVNTGSVMVPHFLPHNYPQILWLPLTSTSFHKSFFTEIVLLRHPFQIHGNFSLIITFGLLGENTHVLFWVSFLFGSPCLSSPLVFLRAQKSIFPRMH